LVVQRVRGSSRADRAGVRSGDDLVGIGALDTRDALDVAFALGWLEDDAPWRFRRAGREFEVPLPLQDPVDNGITLETDSPRVCPNHCVFCFVDQLPRGLRKSLYVKDEDFRLSFTCGSYITLTNLTDESYERIEKQRLSPLYVSIHATDDTVRRRMLGNPHAPSITESLRRLTDAGITLHGQVVVCPGLNDGDVLRRTLDDLVEFGPSLASVAVVPVGLTAHRDGLFPLKPVRGDDALDILTAIENVHRARPSVRERPRFFASDEIYLIAERELPDYEEYGDFEQLENGVGLLRLFERTLTNSAADLEGAFDEPLEVVVLTGELAAPFLTDVTARVLGNAGAARVTVVAVRNEFLGHAVTVAGLLSGEDLVRGVREAPRSALVLLPREAFNADGLTLDGMTIEDIAGRAGHPWVRAADDIVQGVLSAATKEDRS